MCMSEHPWSLLSALCGLSPCDSAAIPLFSALPRCFYESNILSHPAYVICNFSFKLATPDPVAALSVLLCKRLELDFIPSPPRFHFPSLVLWQGGGFVLPCSRELLVRLWLDMDVSIPLVSLLYVVWGGRCSEAELLNTGA